MSAFWIAIAGVDSMGEPVFGLYPGTCFSNANVSVIACNIVLFSLRKSGKINTNLKINK